MTASDRPLVSIIVPVYNVERYLDCCLDSIRRQTYERLEIIVVEDRSSDGSLARMQPHLTDPRVRMIRHEQNLGLSAARNTGIEVATGDYVMFVDSDDAIAPSLVETCVARALESCAEVLVFDFVTFRDGEPTPCIGGVADAGGVRRLSAVEYFSLPHFAWLKFIKRKMLNHYGLRFPVGYYYEDWPFHWELGFSAKTFIALNVHWYAYRQRATSITASMGRKLLDQFKVQQIVLKAFREHGGLAGASAFSTKVHTSFWAVLSRIDAELLLEAITSAKELRSLLRGVVSAPPRNGRGVLMAALLSLPTPVAHRALSLVRWLKQVTSMLGAGASREKSPI